jgi:hypothetical protein
MNQNEEVVLKLDEFSRNHYPLGRKCGKIDPIWNYDQTFTQKIVTFD